MVEMAMQKADLSNRLSQVRSYIGPTASHALQREVNDSAQISQTFEEAFADLKAETDQIEREIETYRNSTLFRESQAQKDRIVELCEACTIEQRKHEDVREEKYQLSDEASGKESRHVHEAEVTEKLSRRLDELRRRQIERLDADAKLVMRDKKKCGWKGDIRTCHAPHGRNLR
jgi:hypothetical protein